MGVRDQLIEAVSGVVRAFRPQSHGVSRADAPLLPGRLVTVGTCASRVPLERISEQLAAALAAETGGSTLLVRLLDAGARISGADWARVQCKLNGEFCFTEQLEPSPLGFSTLTVQGTSMPGDPAWLAPLLLHSRRHFQYVLVQAGPRLDARSGIECLTQSDLTFLLLRREPAGLHDASLLLRDVGAAAKGELHQIKPVLYLEAEEPARDLATSFEPGGAPVQTVVHGGFPEARCAELRFLRDRDGVFQRQIRGLAREIGRCRLGLALSSGGAKGLAHIGVIQVLEENGIEIDVVAGCSMGSYVAAVWAAGNDGPALERLAREVENRWGLLKLVDPVFPPRRGFIEGHAVVRRLRRSIGDAHFSDLVMPLRVVATDLDTLERVIFSTGSVSDAVHASSAIPGVCVPVPIGGALYIDGGVTDPLPVDVLQEMGVERILAINTIPTPAYLKCCAEMEREQAALRRRRPTPGRWLNRHLNYFARGNILDTMMRAVHGAQIRVAERACREADLVLRPLACDAKWHDFTHPGKFIALGRRVAGEMLSEIKALARRTAHVHQTAPDKMAIVA
jgi:NTE family protein